MFRSPKFSLFRLWVVPSPLKKTNGDRPPSLSLSDEDERQINIKLSVFFTVVALLFVLAEHLGRVQEQSRANLASDSTAFVSLTLLPLERSGSAAGLSVRFRLSNTGNHSVFYPLNTATSAPIGELVVRSSSEADWTSLSSPSNERLPAIQNSRDSDVRWIEMPPGGWIDGKFTDIDAAPGVHAYAIYVKPTRDANAIRIVSSSYNFLPK